MSILTLQKRIKECGRIRIGMKGPKGQPQKLTTFRFTSFDKYAIETAAKIYGGKVQQCTDKDLEGQWEVVTDASELPMMPGPTEPSQYMELWSGGGCTRRCDGHTELLTGKPCMCDPENMECKPTTRLPIILPDLPGLGVWRLESKGYNAAVELIPTFEFLQTLAGRGQFLQATLALEERKSKLDGKTVRFVVPVIRSHATPRELLAEGQRQALGDTPQAISGPNANGDHVASLPPAAPIHSAPDHTLKQPNPRGAVFAIIHEMGLPPHEDEHKALYYEVLGKYLGRELTTLSAVTDEEWQRIAAWLRIVDAEGEIAGNPAKMPKLFVDAGGRTKPQRDDPFSDVPVKGGE